MKRNSDTWCVHRTPFDEKKHPVCKVGINYHEFPSQYNKMPCLGETEEARKLCPKYLALTARQLEEKEKETNARFQRIGTIRQKIVETVKATKVRHGTMKCPCCPLRVVSYYQASNGHVHAACSTVNCASWME